MPDGATDTINQMINHPAFGQAPFDEQRKALEAHNPVFTKASDEDVQKFIRAHQSFRGEAQQVAAGLPSPAGPKGPGKEMQPPLPQGLQPSPAPQFLPPQPGGAFPTMGQFGYVQKTPNAAATLGTGIVGGLTGAQFLGAPAATIGGLAGGAAGTKYGGSLGRYIGGRFGEPAAGETIGNIVGGTAGAITGGTAGAEVGTMKNLVRQILAKKLGAIPTSAIPEVTAPLLPNTPLVGTPEEIAAYEQRMRILGQEAKDAGTYSAARGAVNKKLNYQQRIKERMEK